MRQPAMVRDRVLARVVDMLEHLRIQLSMFSEPELEVLRQIERPQQYEMAVQVANFLMARLGHVTQPKEPRFDKTRRALAKKKLKGPRGVKTAGPPTEADAENSHGG